MVVTPQQSTLKAAVRLLKARMRQFVYQQKLGDDENIWGPMLIVEKGFLSGALTEWEKVILTWDLSNPALVEELNALVVTAMAQARASVIELLVERVPEVATILDRLPVSTSDLTLGYGVQSEEAN